jgi:selenocysteine lyase/cysteine desulfurase
MEFTRRSFMRSALATGATLAALSDDAVDHVLAVSRSTAGRSPEDLAADEDFWFDVQRAYTVDRSMINLNNGGVCPSPHTVQDAMRRYLEYSNHAPVRTMWSDLEPGVEAVRRDLARLFGCDTEEIAITRNASEALETALFGLQLEPGDEVLTTTQDYPRMLSTLKQRELRDGIVVRKISFAAPPKSPDEVVAAFEQNITPKTKAILVCHVIFLTGQIIPVRDICRLARKHGIPAIVDGAHAFAQFAFKRDDLECDYYGTSLHKWLTAPVGTGFLYVKKDKIADLWPLMAAPEPRGGDIRKFEEIGTHPAANRLAIAEAIRFYEGLGADRKEARLRYLKSYWTDRLSPHDRVRFHTGLSPEQSCAFATVEVDGVDPTKLTAYLWDEQRIIVTPIVHEEFSGIRVSSNVYTTLPELDVFCTTMEGVIRSGLPA